MGKDIEWLRNKLVYLHELDMWNWNQCANSREQSHFEGCLAAYEKALDFLDELDEPETLSINKEQLIKRIENYIPLHNKTVGDVVDGILEIVKQLPEMEILSQEWIREHAKAVAYDGMPDQTEIVYVDELENLLVPKQESQVLCEGSLVLPDHIGETIKRAFDVETISKTIEMLSGTTIEQVAEGFRDGKLEFVDDLDEPEVLSQEWIDRNKEPFHHFENNKVDYYVSTDSLQSLLVPKEESTEEQARERETVASVFGDYLQMAARLKQILGMEVEVKDNEQKD